MGCCGAPCCIKCLFTPINKFHLILGFLFIVVSAALKVAYPIFLSQLIKAQLSAISILSQMGGQLYDFIDFVVAILAIVFMFLGIILFACGTMGCVILCCNIKGVMYAYIIVNVIIMILFTVATIYFFASEQQRIADIKLKLNTSIQDNFVELWQLKDDFNSHSLLWTLAMNKLSCVRMETFILPISGFFQFFLFFESSYVC